MIIRALNPPPSCYFCGDTVIIAEIVVRLGADGICDECANELVTKMTDLLKLRRESGISEGSL